MVLNTGAEAGDQGAVAADLDAVRQELGAREAPSPLTASSAARSAGPTVSPSPRARARGDVEVASWPLAVEGPLDLSVVDELAGCVSEPSVWAARFGCVMPAWSSRSCSTSPV